MSSDAFVGHELPLACLTSLSERWTMILNIMRDPMVMKIIYNTQLALIPLIHNLPERTHLRPEDIKDNETILASFQNLFDPRQAANICDAHSITSETHLELNALFEQYQIQLPSIDNQHCILGQRI